MALDKNSIAKRIAQEIEDGFYVNLGIGISNDALYGSSAWSYNQAYFVCFYL